MDDGKADNADVNAVKNAVAETVVRRLSDFRPMVG